MIKRTRKYVVVKGVAFDDDKNVVNEEHVIDGNYRSAEAVTARARKEYPDLLIKEIEFHEQVCTMKDKEFYKYAEFGEDSIVEPDNSVTEPDDSDAE
jgi:hypothetical protein